MLAPISQWTQNVDSDAPRVAQEVARPLSIDERTLVLATAVSIDFDYFSQHSHGSGFMPWLMPIPMPIPGYPPADAGGAPDVGPAGDAPPGIPTSILSVHVSFS